jgi:hypothetical protein
MNPIWLMAARFALTLTLLDTSLAMFGCAAPNRSDTGAENEAASKERNNLIVGVWEGTSVSECKGMGPCLGRKNIMLTIVPGDKGIGGYYRCEQCTAACQSYNDRGIISNVLVNHRLLSLNVVLPDDQSCIFRSIEEPDEMEGRFYCEQRAIMTDRGVWRAQRSY